MLESNTAGHCNGSALSTDIADHDNTHCVMNTPIQIRKPEVVEDIRKLAKRTRLPITEAVGRAVRAEMQRLEVDRASDAEAKIREVKEIIRRFNELPTVGPMLTDDDLYDEWGLPK